MTKHVRPCPKLETSRLARPLADHPDNVGQQLAAALRTEHVNAIGALLRTRQEPRGVWLQRVRRGLAAVDPPNPERAISRRIEVKVSPAQVYSLADPQPMPVHHRQQQLIALTLPTDAAGGIDHPPRLVRRKILPPRALCDPTRSVVESV